MRGEARGPRRGGTAVEQQFGGPAKHVWKAMRRGRDYYNGGDD